MDAQGPNLASPLVHVGYAKTGSTWLQQHLFAASSGVFRPLSADPGVWLGLGRPDPWDYDRDAARARVADLWDGWQDDAIPVVSWEHFVGVPHSQGFEGPVLRDRLTDLFPDSRYLIVIREQVSTLVTRYEQFTWGSGDASVREYLGTPGKPLGSRFNRSFLHYHRVIEGYYEAVGADRVLVLPWELMAADCPAFVDRIAAFAGASDDARDRLRRSLPFDRRENAGRGRAATVLVRWGNKVSFGSAGLLKRLGRPPLDRRRVKELARRIGPRVPRSAEWVLEQAELRRMRAFGEGFRESNRRTQELTGLDLGAYGYPV